MDRPAHGAAGRRQRSADPAAGKGEDEGDAMSRAGQRQPQRGNRSSLIHRAGLRGAGRWRLPKTSRRCSAPWPKPSRRTRSNRNQKPAAGGAARTRAIFFPRLGNGDDQDADCRLYRCQHLHVGNARLAALGARLHGQTAASMRARPIPPGIIFPKSLALLGLVHGRRQYARTFAPETDGRAIHSQNLCLPPHR